MTRRLTDLSQLAKSMVKKAVEVPKPAPKQESANSSADREAAEVLAYFARPDGNVPRHQPCNPGRDRAGAIEAALAEKDAALNAIVEEKSAADRRIAELERQLAVEREAHMSAARERDRLQGECGRLKGELRKSANGGAVAASERSAPVVREGPTKPTRGLLAANGAISEAFPGEVREQVLAALADALAAARQSGRDRRAGILAGVLAANPATGELGRRRAELKQILKDASGFTDAGTLAALERIGIGCISGRKHWKLEYADIRMPMSKTPSDYRSALNCATDMANRCF